MNKEEKEALLNLEHIVKHWKPDDENDEFANIEYNSIKVAVNLIYKLQKENEELENNFSKQWQEFRSTHISKDKIRTKIKELEKAKEKEEYIDEYGVRNIPVLNGLIDLKIEALKELLGDE